MIKKPEAMPDYCRYYVNLAKENDLIESLKNSRDMTVKLLSSVPHSKENYSYAPGKWTVKQLVSHLADCERIYLYRALRFSRRDDTQLPGFEEDDYAKYANTENRTLKDLTEEYKLVRESGIILFEHITEEMLDFSGVANNVFYSPRSLGWMAAGHNIHHCNMLREKYL
ncbi:MAG: DinB family protein [Bacteroidetes bacterium]|nr:DinB family protein [Bacteroidota bacterium]